MKQKNQSLLVLKIIFCVFLAGSFASCGSSKKINTDYLYFSNGSETVSALQKETVIQPNDLLSIQVYSRTLNQEQAAIFNIPATAGNAVQGNQVNSAGDIEMPVIGLVKAAGLTKTQLQAALVQKLTDNVKNPSVLVRFLQFNVNVLGEVRSPGTQKFTVDQVTIIDAISGAGDLTDNGKRDNILVIREEGGKKKYYYVDLRSKNVFESPVYLLQPNDIVYVSPNKSKLRNLNADTDTQRRTGLIFTFITLALNVTSLIVFFIRS